MGLSTGDRHGMHENVSFSTQSRSKVPYTVNARWILLLSVLSLFLTVYAVIITFHSVRLQAESRGVAHSGPVIPSPVVAQFVSEVLFDKMGQKTKNMVLEEVVRELQMPLIFTDNYGDPMIWFNITYGPWFCRREIEYDDTTASAKKRLKAKVEEFEKKYDPKLVYYTDHKTKIGWLYYNDFM